MLFERTVTVEAFGIAGNHLASSVLSCANITAVREHNRCAVCDCAAHVTIGAPCLPVVVVPLSPVRSPPLDPHPIFLEALHKVQQLGHGLGEGVVGQYLRGVLARVLVEAVDAPAVATFREDAQVGDNLGPLGTTVHCFNHHCTPTLGTNSSRLIDSTEPSWYWMT